MISISCMFIIIGMSILATTQLVDGNKLMLGCIIIIGGYVVITGISLQETNHVLDECQFQLMKLEEVSDVDAVKLDKQERTQ